MTDISTRPEGIAINSLKSKGDFRLNEPIVRSYSKYDKIATRIDNVDKAVAETGGDVKPLADRFTVWDNRLGAAENEKGDPYVSCDIIRSFDPNDAKSEPKMEQWGPDGAWRQMREGDNPIFDVKLRIPVALSTGLFWAEMSQLIQVPVDPHDDQTKVVLSPQGLEHAVSIMEGNFAEKIKILQKNPDKLDLRKEKNGSLVLSNSEAKGDERFTGAIILTPVKEGEGEAWKALFEKEETNKKEQVKDWKAEQERNRLLKQKELDDMARKAEAATKAKDESGQVESVDF